MNLADLFEQLRYGELRNLKLGRFLDPDADPELKREVITHVNLGLTELHKRFWIISKDMIVRVLPDKFQYLLSSTYAKSGVLSYTFDPEEQERERYILDDRYLPFQDDLLKIEQIYNTEGEKQPLNDSHVEDSFYTPRFNLVQIPEKYGKTHDWFSVEYRANHPHLEVECLNDPCSVQLDLPPAMLDPLLLFVGHRARRTMNTDDDRESMAYLQKYEAACALVKNMGLEVVPDRTNPKLDNYGWV
jgi:hypothetical protein